jgi:hypothetical protein
LFRFVAFVAFHVNSGKVNENIFTFLATDETETLGRIESLDCSYVSF